MSTDQVDKNEPDLDQESDQVPTLIKWLEELADEEAFAEMLKIEGVDRSDLLVEAREILSLHLPDITSDYRELRNAEKNIAHYFETEVGNGHLTSRISALYGLVGFFLLGSIATVVLKLFGLFPSLSYAAPLVAFFLTILASAGISLVEERRTQRRRQDRHLNEAPVEFERLLNSFEKRLKSLILIPALRKASRPNFVDPVNDVVKVTDAPGLTSRIGTSAQIQTSAFRSILIHLRRAGGTTIGLAGPRGVGKTELLRSFCDSSKASVDKGGTVGVLVPAPVAYEAAPFLRVLIRRLCEKVPGYDPEAVTRPSSSFRVSHLVLGVFGVVCLGAGAAMNVGWSEALSTSSLSWALIGIGIAIVYISLLLALLARSGLSVKKLRRGIVKRSEDGDSSIHVEQAKTNLKLVRKRIAKETGDVARGIVFAETRTVSREASLSWREAGFKNTFGMTLARVPLTEADLVAEFGRLVSRLKEGGYEVVIGIDELDKLEADEKAESFLNSMKVLFPIRDCSFLVSISESAWAKFARRGLPIRDVFDSSLDTVVFVEALSFQETRALIRRREAMSDTQILLCHCLSGGLARDLLRFARRLGEINDELGGSKQLTDVTETMLRTELRSKAEGVILSLRESEESIDSQRLLGELIALSERVSIDDWKDTLDNFLRSDPAFAAEVLGLGVDDNRETHQDTRISHARRQFFSYMHFLHCLGLAFRKDGAVSNLGGSSEESKVLAVFEDLACARRQLEKDARSAWIKIDEVARQLGQDSYDVVMSGRS